MGLVNQIKKNLNEGNAPVAAPAKTEQINSSSTQP